MPMTTGVVEHFDTCLGCMACETACPSGVRYAPLIEETRAAIEHHHRRPAGERAVPPPAVSLLPYPGAAARCFALPLALVADVLRGWPGLLALLPAPAAQPASTLAPTRRSQRRLETCRNARRLPERARLRVGLLTGCVQRVVLRRRERGDRARRWPPKAATCWRRATRAAAARSRCTPAATRTRAPSPAA